jgi:predicted GIY-YIG superfamily endonuclease
MGRFVVQYINNGCTMFYVYIIQSINFPQQFYTGFSENIEGRLEGHNEGKSVYTSKFKPWKLVFRCGFDDKKKALDFEKYLKTASGIAFRNKRLI